MKKTIKIFSVLFVLACFFSCDDNNDLGFAPSEELGWIQFVEGGPAVISTSQVAQELIQVAVNIQVPTTSSDLTINYNLVSVSGMDPNTAFTSNNGSIVSPAGETSYAGPDNNTGINYAFLPTIDFDVAEIATNLTEPMVFDVVLTGTSSSMITVGLNGEDFPIIQRIQVCPSLFDSADGTYLGDYILTVPSGQSSIAPTPLFTEGITVTLTEGPNGSLSRSFTAIYLPAFSTTDETMTFTFIDGKIIIDDTVTDTGCSSAIIIGANTSAISSPCDDSEITLNYLDFKGSTGGCGVGDIPIQLLLTKV